jgi:hypothetical protein
MASRDLERDIDSNFFLQATSGKYFLQIRFFKENLLSIKKYHINNNIIYTLGGVRMNMTDGVRGGSLEILDSDTWASPLIIFP